MALARLHRLTVLFVLFGLFLPVAPRALGFPHDGHYCFDIRVGDSQCALAALVCVGIAAALRAWLWPSLTPGERWRTWPIAAGVVLGLVILPLAPLPYWHWDALR